jgi:hypothetical protein
MDCFSKAIGIDPGYTDAQKNKANMYGKVQYYTITGSPTPTIAPWKLGGDTTRTVTPTPTGTLIAPSVVTTPVAAQTTLAESPVTTSTPVPRKTTYSPLSPLTTLWAITGICGLFFLIQRNKK